MIFLSHNFRPHFPAFSAFFPSGSDRILSHPPGLRPGFFWIPGVPIKYGLMGSAGPLKKEAWLGSLCTIKVFLLFFFRAFPFLAIIFCDIRTNLEPLASANHRGRVSRRVRSPGLRKQERQLCDGPWQSLRKIIPPVKDSLSKTTLTMRTQRYKIILN